MMKSLYRYREERHYPKPPEAIWPFVADTARINELSGSPIYQVEERADADGRIHRLASVGIGPIRLRWEDGYSEWQENRRIIQTREFRNGPIRRFEAAFELDPDGTGSRLVYSADIDCVGVLGWLALKSGQFDREGNKRLAVVEKLIAEAGMPDHIPGSSTEEAAKPAVRRRLATLIAELDRDPASHGLAPKLSDFLLHAPMVALRGMRPLALARSWHAEPAGHRRTVPRRATLSAFWRWAGTCCARAAAAPNRASSICTICRAARTARRATSTMSRDFTRNVELTFHPGAVAASAAQGRVVPARPRHDPHVRFQAEVGPRARKSFAVTLAPGPYRFRTIEAGGEADARIA